MSDDRTPLEELDSAIEKFLRDTDQISDGFLTGWALVASTARIQSDSASSLPMVSGATYTFGPQTSIIQFAGLATYLNAVAEKATWNQLSDGEDDDD